jgi:3-oxoacyl-[acyl-carrier protein] reductase
MRDAHTAGLAGRVALVRRLAAEGTAVALAYSAHGAAAGKTAAQAAEDGGQAMAVGADLRRPQAPAELVNAVERALGPVDVLVANAGIGRTRSWEAVSSADFDEATAVNLRAPFLLAQRTLPGMQERRFGRILFISSVAAFTGGLIGPHYAASKAGSPISLAARTTPFGVTVNALAPALIAETGLLPGDPQELRQQVPVGRLGHPDEVADLALAILRNPYLTNQVVSLDGGMYPR